MPDTTLTLDQIKAAFYSMFEGAGELYFGPTDADDPHSSQVHFYWGEMVEKLTGKWPEEAAGAAERT